MKLLGIRIKGFQQFQDLKLDFTDRDGNPLEKICFIGRNGTGKSILLKVIDSLIRNLQSVNGLAREFWSKSAFYAKVELQNKEKVYFFCWANDNALIIFPESIEECPTWFDDLTTINTPSVKKPEEYLNKYSIEQNDIDKLAPIQSSLPIKDNATDLLIYSPPEAFMFKNEYSAFSDVPNTNLSESLGYFKQFPAYHIISQSEIIYFWRVLTYLVKKRDNEREEFERLPENINKTKRQLIDEFEKYSPEILSKLSTIWNRILEPAGLEFDLESIVKPIQLNDNLKAYIRIKHDNKRINYNELSTGIRNYLFRIGHIYSLYFNRIITNGFLLIDEPENSLFPDFLFNLMETYQEIVKDKNGDNNTQIFMATHSPIIAAQFKPEERILLDWNEDGFVEANKGVAPEGDDPNDILSKDFQLRHLMGKKGQEVWNEYVALREKLARATGKQEKDQLISQLNKIGSSYNFDQ